MQQATVTFGITTEAKRRGPLGAVSPVTALSPAITAALAVEILGERLTLRVYVGVALALVGIVLLSLAPGKRQPKFPPRRPIGDPLG